MAKGPIITHRVEGLIASIYQKHPKWTAPMVRNEVSHLLREDNPKLPPDWPSLSTVQKILATVRKKRNELLLDPQEKPWSLATLDSYPIPPDVLPAVLKARKRWAEDEEKEFSVRMAKWAARLSGLTEYPLILAEIADFYATYEKLFELIEQPFDTSILDDSMAELAKPSDLKAETKELSELTLQERINQTEAQINQNEARINQMQIIDKCITLQADWLKYSDKSAFRSYKAKTYTRSQLGARLAGLVTKLKEAEHERSRSQEVQE